MRRITALAAALLLLLAACTPQSRELPQPAELFGELRAEAGLDGMVDVAANLLEANTGISPENYTAAAYYIPEASTAPDEIVILRAADRAAAERIKEKLEDYLDYRIEAAQTYLTEHMPVLQKAVVRTDGLTVSLIISQRVEDIVKVYDDYS